MPNGMYGGVRGEKKKKSPLLDSVSYAAVLLSDTSVADEQPEKDNAKSMVIKKTDIRFFIIFTLHIHYFFNPSP